MAEGVRSLGYFKKLSVRALARRVELFVFEYTQRCIECAAEGYVRNPLGDGFKMRPRRD